MNSSSHPLASPPHHLTSVSIASYLPARHLCHLHTSRGKLLHTMSHHRHTQQLLHMEEALYLLERGLLELLLDDVPVTVQEGYALMEVEAEGEGGGGGLDVYLVYAELRAQGWVVLRPSALYREKRMPPPPPPPIPTEEVSDDGEGRAVAVEAAVPLLLSADEPADSSAEVEWSELEWGCTDDDERAHSGQLLQLPFIASSNASSATTLSHMSTVSTSMQSLLSSLALFVLWPPSIVSHFRRSSPPRPSHLLVVSSYMAADNERLGVALRTPAGVLAVWQRAEREMRGVDEKGERVVAVQGLPIRLATVQLTRVSYVHFEPYNCSPTLQEVQTECL